MAVGEGSGGRRLGRVLVGEVDITHQDYKGVISTSRSKIQNKYKYILTVSERSSGDVLSMFLRWLHKSPFVVIP